MNVEQVSALRVVNEPEFLRRYDRASTAVLDARNEDSVDRWAGAAEAICGLLGFALNEEPLWVGLHQAVDAVTDAQNEIRYVRERFTEFLEAEYVLLKRRGLSSGAASDVVNTVKHGLLSGDRPTHEDIDDSRAELSTLFNRLCAGVEDWSVFAEPEREARRQVNLIAALGGTGGLVGVASNALAPIMPPFVVGSIVGGVAGGVASLLGFRRRGRRQ